MKTSISIEALSGAEIIAFPPKPDIRTDISNYRVALLLKILKHCKNPSMFYLIDVGRCKYIHKIS